RLALYASFRPTGSQNYSTSFEYMTDRNLYTDEQEEHLSASLNAWILLWSATQFQLNMYGSRVVAVSTQTYTLIEGAIEHEFPFHHKISARARQNVIIPATSGRQVAYALEYSVPIAIPVKRITAVGQVRGTITDERGNGVANALINIGEDAAVSTSSGEFVFSSLKPGVLYLTLDKASIGLDKITTQPLPMELDIRGGDVTNVPIRITRSVSVTGTVDLWEAKEASLLDTSTTLLNLGGKGGVFLELSNGFEVNRRVTDSRGRFVFADIRPGTWVLKVIGGDIPAYHVVDPDTLELVLQPGEKREVALQLKPRKRTIKFLQEGGVIQEKPASVGKKMVMVDTAKKVEPLTNKVQPSIPCITRFDNAKKGFTLQISSWVTKWKARTVASRAERLTGFKASLQRARIPSLGVRYRVILGIFRDKKSAEAACMKLEPLR
ncbi:MAG TPA: SPOR domain-containing protein, partial [Bacteroidota bacterium]